MDEMLVRFMQGMENWKPWKAIPGALMHPNGVYGYVEIEKGESARSTIANLPWVRGRGGSSKPRITYSEEFIGSDPFYVWRYVPEQEFEIEQIGGKGKWLYPNYCTPAIYQVKDGLFFLSPFVIGPNIFGVVGEMGEMIRKNLS